MAYPLIMLGVLVLAVARAGAPTTGKFLYQDVTYGDS